MMIVCTACGKFFHPKRNGVYIEEGRPATNAKDSNWLPYKIWVGDALECRNCGHEVIAGFPSGPISEHYMPEYKDWKERLPIRVFVTDCR